MTKTKRKLSRLAAMLLALAVLFSLAPAALAAEPASSVTLTFTNSGVTASGSGSGYKIEGTALTINEAGTYTITGSCAEGSITVKKGTTGVTLVLKDLTLTCSETAPLSCNKETETTVYISGKVTLTDKEDPANEDSADTEVADAFEGAAIKVKAGASLTLTGTGSLTLDGSACKNGLKGAEEATVTVDGSLSLTVKAAKNGIACDGTLTLKNGTYTVTAGEDALHSETELNILGGTYSISCGDDAIHSDGSVTIGTASAGPSITVSKCSEGIEGAAITLNNGSGSITASDDGINAVSDTATAISITVNGGTWTVDAGGDGLDAGGDLGSNLGGDIVINGGTTIVFGSANSGNSAMDYDGTCTINGGTLLTVGMNGMNQVPSSGTYVLFNGVSVTKGSALTVTDASGKTLVSTTATKSANCVTLCADGLSQGESYTLSVGGKTTTATASAGNGQGGMMGGMGGMMGGRGGMTGGFGGQMPFSGEESESSENTFGQMPFDAESGATPNMGGRGGMGGFGQMPFGSENSEGEMPAFGQMPVEGEEGTAPFQRGNRGQLPLEDDAGAESGVTEPAPEAEEATETEEGSSGMGLLDFFRKLINWIFHGQFTLVPTEE